MRTGIGGKFARGLVIGLLVLVVNSSWLLSLDDPSVGYLVGLFVHFGLGSLLTVLFLLYLRQTWSDWSRLGRWSAAILLISAGLGVFLLLFGATRPWAGFGEPMRWVGPAHALVGGFGVLLMVGWLAGRLPRWSMAWRVIWVVLLFSLSLPIVWRWFGREERAARAAIINPLTPPLTMDGEGQGPKGPFFPSSATTNTGGTIPANFFLTSESCARCHQEIYDQWNDSAHHFASFNNQWYRKSIEYMQDTVGTQPSKWCAGCHDHAVLFSGKFDKPIREQIQTPEAQAGLGCASCHSIAHVRSSMGQADFEMEYPPLHDLAVSENPFLKWGHDMLTYVKPELHARTFIKPFMRENTAEYCASCHKVHLDKPVNDYRWFRGFNDYDNWQASGVSGQGARAFYYPAQAKKCADCHMPLVDSRDPAAKKGKVKSHRFPGANTALPYVNGHEEQLKITKEFLQDGQISIDIFGMSQGKAAPIRELRGRGGDEGPRLASTFGVGEESMQFGAGQVFLTEPVEVIGPLDRVEKPTVRRGDEMRLEVVVRTRKVGHFFPGGTVDGFDVWVELQAVDETGRVLFWSGQTEDDGSGRRGPVEKGAHFYRSLMLDEHGNPINKRNAWAARSTAYVRLIPPGAADTIHYRLQIPPDCGQRITIQAKVNYRKFAWWNTQWSYAGVRDPQQAAYSIAHGHDDGKWVFTGDPSTVSGRRKEIPDLPIVVMAEASVALSVIDQGEKLPPMAPVLTREVRERWNDYGIGLLLQGDIKGAEAAFLKVTKMEPGYADGWVNVARARIQEGNLAGASEVLQEALRLAPELAKAHYFTGLALKGEGRYDEALRHLRRASGQYPRDRVVLNTIGRILFLKRQYREAVSSFERVLRIDPEDLTAHYNLMLCYQGLGETALAERERMLYQRFKADESSQAITGPYRQLHPEDNNERQQIHEHGSIPLPSPVRGGTKRGQPPGKLMAGGRL
jgi:Tfp pilus assembly protein PilF